MPNQYQRSDADYIAPPASEKPVDLAALVQQQAVIIRNLETRMQSLERKLLRLQSEVGDIDTKSRRNYFNPINPR